MCTKRKLWSKSIGERGNRVRVYEPRAGARLMCSIFTNGKEVRKSLGHSDKKLAVTQAYQIVAKRTETKKAAESGSLTLGVLESLYLRSPAHIDKKQRTQADDTQRLARVVKFFGPTRRVDTLSESDVRRFVRARSVGDSSLLGVRPGHSVKARAIEADLVTLTTALNWATRERTATGARLLRENPLFGIKMPREKNPQRPVMDHDTFGQLLEAAGRVDSRLQLALVVAEGSGRRISAIRLLRWDDVNLQERTIRWRAENDKRGYEQVVPMNEAMHAALSAARAAQPTIGLAYVFPSSKARGEPASRYIFDWWLRQAYKLAGVQPQPGGMWHPIRRKWATERKHYPIKDVAAAGGWRDVQTLLASYQRADDETIREVVLNPAIRLRRSANA